MRIHQKLFIAFLVLLNLLPFGGIWLELWNWHQTLYFYWAESALIGAFIFITYAKHLFVFVLVLLPAIFLADKLEGNLWQDMKAQAIFWCIYSLYWLAYFELKYTRIGVRIHRLHPLSQLVIYVFFMALGIAISFGLTMTLLDEWSVVQSVQPRIYQVFLLIAVSVPTLVIGILKIIHMIGARHFLYFLLGTYHRPVEKQRVVLFLDMVGSSKMAETLEPKESMRLVASFIFDASAIIRSYGGDILNYTGDGLVVTWKLPQADKAIGCVYAMRRRFEKIRPTYQKEYGLKPYFRMGLHAGPVVIAQVGEEKLFLGLYGDTVNTASRLEGLNKQLGTKVLVSGAVSQWISPKWTSRLEPKGLFEIQGRREMVDVYTLRITD